MEKLLKDYDIPLVNIDGKALGKLAVEKKSAATIEDLIMCIEDYEETMLKVIKVPKLMFKGKGG